MYGRIPVRAPSWIGALHRWSGRAAVLLTVPVAVHCLYALGFEGGEPRVLVHSLFGCFFYGAFRREDARAARPAPRSGRSRCSGGAVFAALTGAVADGLGLVLRHPRPHDLNHGAR
jgi:hypothetical protein